MTGNRKELKEEEKKRRKESVGLANSWIEDRSRKSLSSFPSLPNFREARKRREREMKSGGRGRGEEREGRSRDEKNVWTLCTVDVQFGRVGGRSSRVRGDAGVLPRMPRSHGLDGQLFDAFPGVGHDHVHPIGSDRLVIEGPSDLERGVAFGHYALYRDQVPGVHWLVAERDRRDLWRDCEQPATRPRCQRDRTGAR